MKLYLIQKENSLKARSKENFKTDPTRCIAVYVQYYHFSDSLHFKLNKYSGFEQKLVGAFSSYHDDFTPAILQSYNLNMAKTSLDETKN